MKNSIYYFTGTGNSLAVARELAEDLGETELISIPRAMQKNKPVADDVDMVGIVFPVYFLDMPGIVKEFVKTIRFLGNPYIFGIATCGERPGHALFSLQSLLREKGTTLSAGFCVVMPENFIGPVDLMEDTDIVQEKISQAHLRIPQIAEEVRKQKHSSPEGSSSVFLQIGGLIGSTLATFVYNTPKRLHATARCNHCRTCEKICPTSNITVTDSAVVWHDACTQCYACIHWCPEQAIEIGGRTAGKRRYHHPDIILADMKTQRGE